MKAQTTASNPFGHPPGVLRVMNAVLAVTALVAVAALILEYGFHPPPLPRSVLWTVEGAVVAVFVIERVVRFALARRPRQYLRDNWTDFALIAVAGIFALIGRQVFRHVLGAGALYVLITQAYILVALVLRAVGANLRFAGSGIHPTWLLIGSFAFFCLAGSGLLMLPAATSPEHPIGYQDALFTATSATCVTGLIVRDTGDTFTPFGQAIILALIQMGGLGIMLFGTMLAMLVGKGLSMRGSDTVREMVGAAGIGRFARIVKFVIVFTFAIELVGVALLYPMFSAPQGAVPRLPETAHAVWDSIFHSISSFCNAGFSLYGENMMAGVREGWNAPLRDRWQVLGVMAPLIVLGGLGFPVLQDCASYGRALLRRAARLLGSSRPAETGPSRRAALSLHSKIVLFASAVLIVLGAAALLVMEPGRDALPPRHRIGANPIGQTTVTQSTWRDSRTPRRIREALFQSVTARTAGFNTFDVAELSDAGKLSLCGLMVIGGSPASTAGGMKTVTAALLLLTVYSVVARRNELEVFKRSISAQLLRRTVALATLYLMLVAVTVLLLCVAMPGIALVDLLFEACSACGTVGLSTGVTPHLNFTGKSVIIGAMFLGRIGPVTLLLALTTHLRHVRYAYPSEDVVIG